MLWSLALLPALAGAALYAAGPRARFRLGAAACAVLALTLVLAILAAAMGWTGALGWSRDLALSAALTPLSAAMAILVPAIALPVLLYAAAHERADGLIRLVALLLLFVGGMELVVIAADLLTLLIGWEIVGACSWALIGHDWRDGENPRAGLYAFITTRLGDLGLFIAALAAFAGAGSFAYADLGGLASPYPEIVAFGVLVSAAAKSAQVPFAPWLFRAMAGPTSVSALLHAAAMVAAGAYLLIRLQPALARADGFAAAAIAIGLVTALAGGLVALLQPHAKKLLAASTSANFGLMFVAVGLGYPGVALLHLVAHAAFKAPLFLAAGLAATRAGTEQLDGMRLGLTMPLTAALSAVAALALAGLPPLGGGWTKEAITAAAEHRSLWLAAAVMAAGALSAAYAARFQLLAFGTRRDPPAGPPPHGAAIAGLTLAIALTLALSILWVPRIETEAAALLGVTIPSSSTAGLVVSLILLVLGLVLGIILVRRQPRLGSEGGAAAAADWLGMPSAISHGVTHPFNRLAAAAARLDTAIFDAVPRALARGAVSVSGALSRGDERLVDRGVAATAAFAAWLAGLGERLGERLTDTLPEGSAWLVGISGADARRLQTGLSHHYFALFGAGAALSVIILILVS